MAAELRAAVLGVLDSGSYILGPEGRKFEAEFSRVMGLGPTVGVSSGSDALRLSLEAVGVGPGDEVIVPAFTFIATATAVSETGARPVFADVDPRTLTLDPAHAEALLTKRTKAILPVHLFGQAADMDGLSALARSRGLKVIEDCAQAHLTRYKGRPAGSFGELAAFSFYPSKSLGAVGDAGALTSEHPELAELAASLRNCGRAASGGNYNHERIGHNCRLDEIQAAVLLVKLKRLVEWTRQRREVAALYNKELEGLPVGLPQQGEGGTEHSFHLYVIRTPRRDELAKHLAEDGIGSGVYYPLPAHLQPAYESLGGKPGDLPHSEEASRTVLALPIRPELTARELARICRSIRTFFSAPAAKP